MRAWVAGVGLVAAGVLAGCGAAKPGAGDLPVSAYSGHFTGGAGASWFRPCAAAAGDTLWWTTFMNGAVAQMAAHREAGRVSDGSPAFLRVRAGLSERESAGADGRGTRYIYVHDVVEVRPPGPEDCGR